MKLQLGHTEIMPNLLSNVFVDHRVDENKQKNKLKTNNGRTRKWTGRNEVNIKGNKQKRGKHELGTIGISNR